MLSPGKFTWLQGARREAGAVIISSNRHLICTINEKTLCQVIEQVSRKKMKVWWRLWNVSGPGRLFLRYFSLLIVFTLDCRKIVYIKEKYIYDNKKKHLVMLLSFDGEELAPSSSSSWVIYRRPKDGKVSQQ